MSKSAKDKPSKRVRPEARLKAYIVERAASKDRYLTGAQRGLSDLKGRYPFPGDDDGATPEERAATRKASLAEIEAALRNEKSRAHRWSRFGVRLGDLLQEPEAGAGYFRSINEAFEAFGANPNDPFDWLDVMHALSDAFFPGVRPGRPKSKEYGSREQRMAARHISTLMVLDGYSQPQAIKVLAALLHKHEPMTSAESHAKMLRKLNASRSKGQDKQGSDDSQTD
jgi:hypothetical protein